MILSSKTVIATETLTKRFLTVTYTPYEWVTKIAAYFNLNLQPHEVRYEGDGSYQHDNWCQTHPQKKLLQEVHSAMIDSKYNHVNRQQKLNRTAAISS